MPTDSQVPPIRRPLPLAWFMLLAVVVTACGGAQRPTLTPPSLPETSPSPTTTGPVGTPPPPTPTSTVATTPWPAGWDLAFCTVLEELIVAQELARDIGRAYDEGDRADATALARELDTTVERVGQLAALLPDWADAADFEEQLLALLEQDERLVTYWLRHLELNRGPALDRARAAAGLLRDTYVPAVQAALDDLATLDVACPGMELKLETP